MGILLNGATGERLVLRANHVFGRNASRSDTYLSDRAASLIHAIVRWSEGRWAIVDHSRNGTLLDGRPLAKGEWVPITEGQTLSFGLSATHTWHVDDLSPPGTLLVPLHGHGRVIRLGHTNILPLDGEPQMSIYQDESGQWVQESMGDVRILRDGDLVSLDGRDHSFIVDRELDSTKTMGTMGLHGHGQALPQLRFRLSLDEEHTTVEILHGPQRADLGERSHHYCLATLARRRLADAQRALDPEAQGWLGVADLAAMLGMDVPHVNIQIFRVRNQVMSAMPHVPQMANIIERRRGEVRMGAFTFEILRGSQQEGRYQAAEPHRQVAALT